jgi:hypothetical protein
MFVIIPYAEIDAFINHVNKESPVRNSYRKIISLSCHQVQTKTGFSLERLICELFLTGQRSIRNRIGILAVFESWYLWRMLFKSTTANIHGMDIKLINYRIKKSCLHMAVTEAYAMQ